MMKTGQKPLVVGSVAFDLLFPIRGRIQDEILIENGKLGRQNLMFTAKKREHFFGGTGGNIAYGLGLLGKRPFLFSLAGHDFRGEFEKHLERHGVDCRVTVDEKSWTASFYGMRDEEGQQIGVYQPNAYERIDKSSMFEAVQKKELAKVPIAIFSAGTGASILRHIKEFRSAAPDALVILDPGQVISVFYDRKLFEQTLELSDILIGNEVEIKQMQSMLGVSVSRVLTSGPRAVIETLGEKGSVIHEKSRKTSVPAVKAKKIAETTGAGDAYRAGMIAKLLEGRPLAQACEFGAHIASYSVAYRGGQTYRLPKLLKTSVRL